MANPLSHDPLTREYGNPFLVHLPLSEDVECMGSNIYRDLIHDFPRAIYFKGERLKKMISLQWVRFFLNNGRLEESDPPFWEGNEDQHRKFVPTVIKALLPKDSTFLSESTPMQLMMVARINRLLDVFFKSKHKKKIETLNWNNLSEEARCSMRKYMLQLDNGPEKQLVEDASKMADDLYPFFINMPEEDSKENL